MPEQRCPNFNDIKRKFFKITNQVEEKQKNHARFSSFRYFFGAKSNMIEIK